MTRVTCFIRPHRLEQVKSAIGVLLVTGMSVSDVRGTGNSKETSDWFGGEEGLIALPIRSRVEVVAIDDLTEEIVQAIITNAYTGEDGDGTPGLDDGRSAPAPRAAPARQLGATGSNPQAIWTLEEGML